MQWFILQLTILTDSISGIYLVHIMITGCQREWVCMGQSVKIWQLVNEII